MHPFGVALPTRSGVYTPSHSGRVKGSNTVRTTRQAGDDDGPTGRSRHWAQARRAGYPGALNKVLVRLVRRAEASDPARLVATFVDAGPLMPLLSSTDHQIVFGRRGAGKTHALGYLAETKNSAREPALFLDMRQLGSSAGLYTSGSLPLAERGTRLLVDALAAIHERLRDTALAGGEDSVAEGGQALVLLDMLADQITRVRVVGSVELQSTDETETADDQSASMHLDLHGPGVRAGERSHSKRVAGHMRRTKGVTEHSVHFGAIGKLLTDVLDALGAERLWLLMDEWSSLPSDLQPLLADLLRRCILPLRNVTVKIAAIEQRSHFSAVTEQGDHLGFELGADISADIDLDDFVTFDNDAARAKSFFAELLTRHVNAHLDPHLPGLTAEEFTREVFADARAFAELVRAAEGVPRDALNVAIVAAEHADNRRISVRDVRAAARTWYRRDKAPAAMANPDAWELLLWVIDRVIGPRRGRAFLVPAADSQHPLIRSLYDARVLHVVRRNIALRDRPGIRYHVYTIDYGCYYDVVVASQRTHGPRAADAADLDNPVPSAGSVHAIRNAVLDLHSRSTPPG